MYLKTFLYFYSVGSVCLPEPHEEFHNRVAFASGWGRIGPPEISTRQSPELRIVDLVVRKVFRFGRRQISTVY